MLNNYQELELYSLLQNAKEQIFSCFRQIASPINLPEIIEFAIKIEENTENYECIRAFCIFYEGLYFEELSLRATDEDESEEGYILVWYKDLEGLDLRDKVLCKEIK